MKQGSKSNIKENKSYYLTITGVGWINIFSRDVYREIYVTCFFMLLISSTCFSQTSIDFLKYDQATYNRTVNLVYKYWNESKVSKEHHIDTILCVFLADFDTLDLKRVRLNEEVLKRNMELNLHLSEEEFQRNKKSNTEYSDSFWSAHNPDIYDCDCEVYDLDGNTVASIVSQQGFYVFENYRDKYSYSEHLKTRLMQMKDKMVFIPTSKRYTLNFNWRLAIDQNGNIVWYNIDSPYKNYSSEALFLNHSNHFFL